MTEAELVNRWMAVVDDLGLLLAAEPAEKVEASLELMRRNLSDEFCALFPNADPETMMAGVNCIIAEIQKRRRAIEAAGTPRVLN
jgi:hypothetical protein